MPTLVATAAFGLEAVVSRELKALGYDDQTVVDGRVVFEADDAAICRTNLWLRTADRVLLRLADFHVESFDELFETVKAIRWSDLMPVDAAFPVKGRSVKSQLSSVPACQSVVKKAIVESLKKVYQRHHFEETGPEYIVEVSILRNRATITLDTTGAGLHKRGYRTMTGAAPLRETIAAGLLQLTHWNRERPFLDPLCGTGTIPIEAALIGRNMAPGLSRDFVAERWTFPGVAAWKQARGEARDAIKPSFERPLLATDHDHRALRHARKHARQAGVENEIHFQQSELIDLQSSREFGVIVCNPPYGERIGGREEVEALYRVMGTKFAPLETWSKYVLTSSRYFEKHFGTKAERRRKLYNGRIECTFYQYPGPRPPRVADPATNDDVCDSQPVVTCRSEPSDPDEATLDIRDDKASSDGQLDASVDQ